MKRVDVLHRLQCDKFAVSSIQKYNGEKYELDSVKKAR